MTKHISLGILPTLLLGLSGCGGSDGPPTTGYFVGGLIEGVPYECGAQKGHTGRLGDFLFDPAAPCVFTLGGLTLQASAAALADRAVTPYELTRSATEAWALTAILDSISHRRRDSDLFRIVDGILLQRLPAVDLSQGEAAIAAALAPFKGTTHPVSLQSGRARLGNFIDERNGLKISLEDLIAQGTESLMALGEEPTGTVQVTLGETLHRNRVNLRMYDHDGNWLAVHSVSYTPGVPDDWLWATDGQSVPGAVPIAGLIEGDITGENAFGIAYTVGRKKSAAVANSFKAHAYSPGTFTAPITVLGHGVTEDEQDNSHFGQELNFGFHVNLAVNTGAGAFNCPSLMLAQGSSTTSLKTYLDVAKALIDTAYDTTEYIGSEGEDIPKLEEAVKSFSDLVKSSFDIHYLNWWVLGVNARSESYRTTVWGYPAVLMQCTQNGSPVTVIGYSNYDDHTFNLQVAFAGQKMTVKK